jgi:hypothetical protein
VFRYQTNVHLIFNQMKSCLVRPFEYLSNPNIRTTNICDFLVKEIKNLEKKIFAAAPPLPDLFQPSLLSSMHAILIFLAVVQLLQRSGRARPGARAWSFFLPALAWFAARSSPSLSPLFVDRALPNLCFSPWPRRSSAHGIPSSQAPRHLHPWSRAYLPLCARGFLSLPSISLQPSRPWLSSPGRAPPRPWHPARAPLGAACLLGCSRRAFLCPRLPASRGPRPARLPLRALSAQLPLPPHGVHLPVRSPELQPQRRGLLPPFHSLSRACLCCSSAFLAPMAGAWTPARRALAAPFSSVCPVSKLAVEAPLPRPWLGSTRRARRSPSSPKSDSVSLSSIPAVQLSGSPAFHPCTHAPAELGPVHLAALGL